MCGACRHWDWKDRACPSDQPSLSPSLSLSLSLSVVPTPALSGEGQPGACLTGVAMSLETHGRALLRAVRVPCREPWAALRLTSRFSEVRKALPSWALPSGCGLLFGEVTQDIHPFTNGRGKTPPSSVTSHMVLSLLTPMFGLRRVFRKHTRHCVYFSLSLVILSPSMSASRLISLPWLRNTPCRLRGWAW